MVGLNQNGTVPKALFIVFPSRSRKIKEEGRRARCSGDQTEMRKVVGYVPRCDSFIDGGGWQ